jgi:monothiol glutaredoxin
MFPLIRAATASSRPASRLIRYLSDEARSKIQTAVTATPIVLFMKGTPQLPMCGFSRAAIQVLDLHGVTADKLKTYDVLEDEELRSGIKEFSYVFPLIISMQNKKLMLNSAFRDWPTIPQLYVNGEFVGGCDILIGSASETPLTTSRCIIF